MDEPENLSSTKDVHSSGEDSQESFSLLHPTKIGRYTILRCLGKGGFGRSIWLTMMISTDPWRSKFPVPNESRNPRISRRT